MAAHSFFAQGSAKRPLIGFLAVRRAPAFTMPCDAAFPYCDAQTEARILRCDERRVACAALRRDCFADAGRRDGMIIGGRATSTWVALACVVFGVSGCDEPQSAPTATP